LGNTIRQTDTINLSVTQVGAKEIPAVVRLKLLQCVLGAGAPGGVNVLRRASVWFAGSSGLDGFFVYRPKRFIFGGKVETIATQGPNVDEPLDHPEEQQG